jgi:ribonuclease BN (tRNA processing enzyme)
MHAAITRPQTGSRLSPDRRTFLRRSLALTGLGVLAHAAPGVVGGPATAAAQGAVPRGSAAAGTQLILLGTQGGPNVNLGRGQSASAVVVEGVPYLVDCGYGTVRALVQAGFRLNDVAQLFLTHLHDDHTIDVAALLSLKWTAGQPQDTTVHGPYGTRALVEGAIAFFKGNTDIRMLDEGRPARPEALFRGIDHDAPRQTEVFRDDRVRVLAVENTHFPERAMARMPYRSFAYRIDAADRAIVFSGDTAYSSALVELARGADVLVCEAIETATHQQLLRAAQAAPGGLTGESVARHVIETHVTTEEAGRIAAEAKVRMLVLNHLLPGSTPPRGADTPDERYIEDARKHFPGEIVVGRDQMRL